MRRGSPDVVAVLRSLRERGWTVAAAESVTGGRLTALMTAVPGASAAVRGGVVAYATAAKTEVLGVPADLVADHGVVSAPCAEAMAEGVRALFGADIGIATTGVAGPDLQEGKPVGTVFLALAAPGGTETAALELTGDRTQIVRRSCEEAMAMIVRTLEVPREDPRL